VVDGGFGVVVAPRRGDGKGMDSVDLRAVSVDCMVLRAAGDGDVCIGL
jgi:hypothetical protein